MLFRSRSYGRERLAFVLFVFVLIVSATSVLTIKSMKKNSDLFAFSFKGSMNKAKNFIRKSHPNGIDNRVIDVDNNTFLTVVFGNNESTIVKLPRAGYYFNIVEISEKDALYQYLIDLSNVIKSLSENKNVESNALKVLSFVILDYAAIFYSLPEYDTAQSFNIRLSNEELNKQLYNYLYSLNVTINQLQKNNYEMIEYDNEFTGLKQKNYASNLLKVSDDIESEVYLSKDVVFLVKNIMDQVRLIANSYELTVSKENYLKSKSILIKLIEESSFEENTRFALESPLKASLPVSSEVIVFINTMLTLLKSDKKILSKLDESQKQILLDTVSSIMFKNNEPVNTLIDYNLAAKFNCQKQHGKYNEGTCVLE